MKFTHTLIVFVLGMLLSIVVVAAPNVDTSQDSIVSIDDCSELSALSHALANCDQVYSALPGVDAPCNRCIPAGVDNAQEAINMNERMATNLNDKAEYDSILLTFSRTWTRVMWPNSTELAHT